MNLCRNFGECWCADRMTSTAPDGWDDYVTHHPLGTAYHQAAAVGIGFQDFACGRLFDSTR
jgi:hypothetical protein